MNESIVIFLGCTGLAVLVAALLLPASRPFTMRILTAVWVTVLRIYWWLKIRLTWRAVVRDAGLSVRRTKRVKARTTLGAKKGEESIEKWADPRLVRVKTTPYGVTLKVRTRRGQAVERLEEAAPQIRSSYAADRLAAYYPHRKYGNTCMYDLMMRDLLKAPATAAMPEPRADSGHLGIVDLGRRQNGQRLNLQIIGRQTLCVGASGSGKGSILWGIIGGLAPGIAVDSVRIWGIDLKGGLELGMAQPLFHRSAYIAEEAIKIIDELIETAEARLLQMRGNSREHTPAPGYPLEVLIIDELASLTAYADKDTKREVDPKLKRLLSIGRAVGVVVVAFIQDPRKEVVDARGLFTQTICLRVRTKAEADMTLGDGASDKAAAHLIPITAKGEGWLVDDDSASFERFRADYWPDSHLRELARLYPAGSWTAGAQIPDEVPAEWVPAK